MWCWRNPLNKIALCTYLIILLLIIILHCPLRAASELSCKYIYAHFKKMCLSWFRELKCTNRSENIANVCHIDDSGTFKCQGQFVQIEQGLASAPTYLAATGDLHGLQDLRSLLTAGTENCLKSAFIWGIFGAVYSNSGGGCQHFPACSYLSLESSA